MKKSIFLIAAFVAVFSVPFVSCSGTNDKDDKNKTKEIPKELQELVTEMNKHCPISAGSIGDMVSAEIKGDNVVFTLDVYEDLIDLEYLQSQGDLLKQNIISMVSNPVDQDVKTLVEMLDKYNVGLTYIYKGKGSGKVVEVSMTSDEIRQAAKGAVVGANADEMLQTQIDITNDQFPVDLGNGMMMYRLVREGNVVYYEYTCDESMISVKQISQNKKQVVDEIRKELENGIATDPSVKTFLQICKNADCDLGYRYVGSKTGTVAEAVLPLDDLDLE